MPVIPLFRLCCRDADKMAWMASLLSGLTARLTYKRRTSMSLAPGDQGHNLAAQVGVFEEHTAHDRVDHLAVHVLHTPPGHAVVGGLHHDGQTVRLCFFLDQVGQLHHGLFLDLGPAHDPFGQPGVLAQTDHVGVLVGHDADPHPTNNRAKVVAASAAHSDRTHDHELVQVLGIGELGDGGALDVTPGKGFLEGHLGHTAGGVTGVVVVVGVDDHAVKHTLHFGGDLVQQLVQLAGLYELGDVVVGVETFAGGLDALADLDGHGGALVGCGGRGHVGVGLHQHAHMLPPPHTPSARMVIASCWALLVPLRAQYRCPVRNNTTRMVAKANRSNARWRHGRDRLLATSTGWPA